MDKPDKKIDPATASAVDAVVMPTKEGYYKTDIGIQYCQIIPAGIGLKPGPYWQFGITPRWWERRQEVKQYVFCLNCEAPVGNRNDGYCCDECEDCRA